MVEIGNRESFFGIEIEVTDKSGFKRVVVHHSMAALFCMLKKRRLRNP